MKTLNLKQKNVRGNLLKNVKKPKEYEQVCVLQGVTLDDTTYEEFEKEIFKNFNVRIKVLEEIKTLPNKDKNGYIIQNTGNRNDIFFVCHNEDVSKFSLPRLKVGVRWLEDCISYVNNPNEYIIYPERVRDYIIW